MRTFIWDESDELELPPADAPYSAILHSDSVSTSAKRSILGILVAIVGYTVVLTALFALLMGIFWIFAADGTPYPAFRDAGARAETLPGLVATNLAIGALTLVVMLTLRYVHCRHPRWSVSIWPGVRWRFGIGCALIATVVLNGAYWLTNDDLSFQFSSQVIVWLVAIILTSPLQSMGEEFFFRGYLLQACGAVTRHPIFAVVVSSFVFAIMHGTQNLPLFVDRFGFGLIAGTLVVLTGGLEAAIAAHAVNNVFAFGYAAASTGVAAARAMSESTWGTTASNLLAYLLVAVLCWLLGHKMNVATRTPGLSKH